MGMHLNLSVRGQEIIQRRVRYKLAADSAQSASYGRRGLCLSHSRGNASTHLCAYVFGVSFCAKKSFKSRIFLISPLFPRLLRWLKHSIESGVWTEKDWRQY